HACPQPPSNSRRVPYTTLFRSGSSDAEIRRIVEVRAERQNILRRPDAPEVRAVVDESVLLRLRRHPDLARRQINHLIETAEADKDRKSTRLNSSHVKISYAVFC